MSNLCPQDGQNSGDNVFAGLLVGTEEACLFTRFIQSHDFSENTQRAMRQDVRKFAKWFSEANQESFTVKRITVRDVADFKTHLRKNQGQAVATVSRCLVTLRRYLRWLVAQEVVKTNAAAPIKELRRQELAPKGMERSDVRRLFREVELRDDVRAHAIFSMFLYTGARCGDLVNLDLHDVSIGERSGAATFRSGKGNKQRSVPLPLPARCALQQYLDARPPVQTTKVFVGERGQLKDRGVRALCDKYSAMVGVKIYPHLLRHTFAHSYLEANPEDLVGLAQILGHENLNTTARYTKKSSDDLAEGVDRLDY
ncbi:MAG: tyrosine-type recombinase/integrase [Planctomycetaceae bacterium]|nr:tyrosine-type recombinase/integrase [Planctomycetaceae bacterium]